MSADRRAQLIALLPAWDGTASLLRGICEVCVSELAVSGALVRLLGASNGSGGGAIRSSVDTVGARLDDLALTVGQSPCAEALELGRPILVSDMAAETTRWSAFTADAVTAGVAAMFAFPLQLGATRFGVLALHRDTPGPLTPTHLHDAFVLADAATDAIFDDLNGVEPRTLPGLVDIHAVVHQASGVLAVRLGLSVAEALLRIRGHAYAHQMTLTEVARNIIERRLRLDTGESDRE